MKENLIEIVADGCHISGSGWNQTGNEKATYAGEKAASVSYSGYFYNYDNKVMYVTIEE